MGSSQRPLRFTDPSLSNLPDHRPADFPRLPASSFRTRKFLRTWRSPICLKRRRHRPGRKQGPGRRLLFPPRKNRRRKAFAVPTGAAGAHPFSCGDSTLISGGPGFRFKNPDNEHPGVISAPYCLTELFYRMRIIYGAMPHKALDRAGGFC